MLNIYYCRDCGMYFTENEMGEKEICYEEEYGVAGDFPTKTYARVDCCPYCKSTDYYEESDDEEICELLNGGNY